MKIPTTEKVDNMGETLSVETNRFGRIEFDAQAVLHFNGLPGFANAKRFIVIDHSETESFSWLVSVDDPELAFVIANPWHFFAGYDPAVAPRHLKSLAITEPGQLETVVMATFVGRKGSLNLSAPLLINSESRRGAQVILDDPRYSTREEIPWAEPIAEARTVAASQSVHEAVE
ncbi:MAG: flagellar assembly factor FliW [Myxococcota bacterium]